MQTSILSTADSTQHGDLSRIENGGGNSWKRLRCSLGLARDDDDDDDDDDHSVIGCWHHDVVCLSVCPSVTLRIVAFSVGVHG